jgi:hypothetical protein
MKQILFFFFICVIIISCGVNEEISNESKVITEFKLSDVNGNDQFCFNYGDVINIKYTITNNSNYVMTYHCIGPPIIFKIVHNDTVFATSTDGQRISGTEYNYTLNPGEVLKSEWSVQNIHIWNRRFQIIRDFLKGDYKVIVQHGSLFDNFIIGETKPVYFSVIN